MDEMQAEDQERAGHKCLIQVWDAERSVQADCHQKLYDGDFDTIGIDYLTQQEHTVFMRRINPDIWTKHYQL